MQVHLKCLCLLKDTLLLVLYQWLSITGCAGVLCISNDEDQVRLGQFFSMVKSEEEHNHKRQVTID